MIGLKHSMVTAKGTKTKKIVTRNSSFFKKFQGKIETSLKGKIKGSRDRVQFYQQQRNSGQEKRFELAVEIIPDVAPEVVEAEQGEQEQEEIPEDIPNRRGRRPTRHMNLNNIVEGRRRCRAPDRFSPTN